MAIVYSYVNLPEGTYVGLFENGTHLIIKVEKSPHVQTLLHTSGTVACCGKRREYGILGGSPMEGGMAGKGWKKMANMEELDGIS